VRKIHPIFVTIAALVLAGCASANVAGMGAPPSNYKQLVREHVRKNFLDPYSIRDPEIAAPQPSGGPILVPAGLKEVWVVCFRANAKNFGAYTGVRPTAMLIDGGRVVNSLDNASWAMWCNGSSYEPFPEVLKEST
jgi:hypothetical protein